MKFLVISKMKDTAVALPPSVMRQLMEVSAAAMEQQKKAGQILDFYYSPAGCSVAILEEKNAEEWVKDQTSIPILSYMNFEVYPLSDGFPAMKTLIESLKTAEQMMPGPPK
jgi:muconolactone delta-isomerase